MTIKLSEGCTLICSDEYAARHYEEIAETKAQRELYAELRRAREEMLASDSPEAWDYFSDLFKDYYGVRPHYYSYHQR